MVQNIFFLWISQSLVGFISAIAANIKLYNKISSMVDTRNYTTPYCFKSIRGEISWLIPCWEMGIGTLVHITVPLITSIPTSQEGPNLVFENQPAKYKEVGHQLIKIVDTGPLFQTKLETVNIGPWMELVIWLWVWLWNSKNSSFPLF